MNSQTKRNWPAIAPPNTSMIAVYLCTNLYSTPSAMRYSTAAMASCVVTVSTPSTVVGLMRPVLPTLAPRISIATIAMTPTMEPQIPSKNAARNCVRKEKP